jgi:hypothetical protein
MRDGDVEEVAVVGDQHDGSGIRGEKLLQPVAGFEVEVVRRFVEKQHVGTLQE